jgi:hypothetical protein
MASTYPGTLDNFATSRADADNQATTHPDDHNNANDAINKIEAELGVNPSGSAADVAAAIASELRVRKTADQTFSSTTLANVTDLSFATAANTDYTFEFFLPHTTGAAMGSGWAVTVSGTVTRILYVVEIFGHGSNSNTGTDASVTQVATASGTKLQNAPTAGLTTAWARLEGLLQQGGTGGTLQLQASRGGGATAVNVVVLKGSLGRLTAV